jgi:uncharacterized Zn finger protein (UPF0148 family)
MPQYQKAKKIKVICKGCGKPTLGIKGKMFCSVNCRDRFEYRKEKINQRLALEKAKLSK